MRRLFSLLCLLALAAPAVAAQTGSALFLVVASDGVDVTGTELSVFSVTPGAQPVTATVGDGGLTTVENLPPGDYFAFPTAASGFVPLYSTPATVGGDGGSGILLVLPIDGSPVVRGRVTDAATGSAIPFSQLVLTPVGQAPVGLVSALSQTDGDGAYAFLLPEGSYTLDATLIAGPGATTSYRPSTVTVEAVPGQTTALDLPLTPRELGRIAGRVTDAATGAALPGALLSAYALDNSFFGILIADGQGRFEVELPEGDYLLSFDPSLTPGYVGEFYDGAFSVADATPVTIAPGETTTGIDFTVETVDPSFAVTLTGRLVDTDGQAIPSVQVLVTSDGPTGVTRTALSDDEGAFELVLTDSRFAASSLTVGFVAAGFELEFYNDRPSPIVADRLPVGTTAMQFDLGTVELARTGENTAGFAVSGTVREAAGGAPLGDALVAVARLDAPGVRYATTAPDGAYRVDGLDAGDYVVLFLDEAHAPAFYPSASTWTEASRLTISDDLSGIDGLLGGLNRPVGAQRKAMGRLQGVARTEDGEPLAGALLTARSLDGAVVGFALTDSRGAYTLEAEQGMQMILQADAPRYGVRAAAAALTGDLGFVNVDLSLVMPVSNQDRAEALTGVAIRGLAPNPARTSARALVEVAEGGPARIALFDVLGREVAVLADGELAAGAHEVSLDTARLAPGVYVVRVQMPRGVAAQRLTVVR
jgi:hypothetical protein